MAYKWIATLLIVLVVASGCTMPAQTDSLVPTLEPTPMSTPESAPTATPMSTSAEGVYQPLPDQECEDLRAAVAETLGVEATLEEAPFDDYTSGETGAGCQITVSGTGEDFTSFIDVARELEALLTERGWSPDMAYAADGPTGTAMGLRMDSKLALLNAGWEPSEDAGCPEDVPITECDLAPEQQLYTITINLALTEAPAGAEAASDATATPPSELSAEAENAAMVAQEMLMQELQVDAEAIEIVSVEAMEWPDACLGLAAEDEFCAAVIVPGYRVTLAVDGAEYVYRTNASATNVRLAEAPES